MSEDARTLKTAAAPEAPVPEIAYRPRAPRTYRPKLGLIGCGGISEQHLRAAQSFGLEVVALANPSLENARKRQQEFYPEAALYSDARELLARSDIEVVDIATHPEVRVGLIEAALRAGKHVLSQKPFVLDLHDGHRLADLADAVGRRLAINQNGRWAPHFAWLLSAVGGGLLGEMHSLDLIMDWDHTWCAGTAFEEVRHLVLSDFAIHWFDIAAHVFEGRRAESVFANVVRAPGQTMKPPMLANSVVRFEQGLATLSFSAHARFGGRESFVAVGSQGVLRAEGPLCGINRLQLRTEAGICHFDLAGSWFPDGFRGALGELLCAIEEDREPSNGARANLRSLALCFAALHSADIGQPVVPGTVSSAAR
jgi:predicted dehydrogenase